MSRHGCAAACLALLLAAPAGAAGGEARPALPDLEGRTQDLRALRGRIVVLNFWATWCVPCRAEMPILAALQERYAGRGVQVIGVAADGPDRHEAVRAMARDLGVNFPVLIGATTEEMRGLDLGEALPATAILDPDGRVAARILGPAERRDLEERIDWLLGGRTGPAPEPRLDAFALRPHDHAAEEGHGHAGEGSRGHAGEAGHDHAGEREHAHGGVGLEGASLVPS